VKTNKIARGKMGKNSRRSKKGGGPTLRLNGKESQTLDEKAVAVPHGAQGVGNYMKMQGLDVGDEKRI
jgi:hypothetical protein